MFMLLKDINRLWNDMLLDPGEVVYTSPLSRSLVTPNGIIPASALPSNYTDVEEENSPNLVTHKRDKREDM